MRLSPEKGTDRAVHCGGAIISPFPSGAPSLNRFPGRCRRAGELFMATLAQLRIEVDREWRAAHRPAPPVSVAPRRSGARRALLMALRVAVIVPLPFVVLVRSSV